MKAMREIVHARADVLSAFERFGSSGFVMAVRRPPQQLQLDRQYGQLLADVVVQLPGDAGTLLLLRLQQPPAEVADAVVTRLQRRLAPTQLLFGLSPSRSLNGQPSDQRSLRQEGRHGADNIESVTLPHRGLSILDSRFGRETRRVDPP